jgi:hypothetical protein
MACVNKEWYQATIGHKTNLAQALSFAIKQNQPSLEKKNPWGITFEISKNIICELWHKHKTEVPSLMELATKRTSIPKLEQPIIELIQQNLTQAQCKKIYCTLLCQKLECPNHEHSKRECGCCKRNYCYKAKVHPPQRALYCNACFNTDGTKDYAAFLSLTQCRKHCVCGKIICAKKKGSGKLCRHCSQPLCKACKTFYKPVIECMKCHDANLKVNFFQTIPKECILKIATHLNLLGVQRWNQVCKSFNTVIMQQHPTLILNAIDHQLWGDPKHVAYNQGIHNRWLKHVIATIRNPTDEMLITVQNMLTNPKLGKQTIINYHQEWKQTDLMIILNLYKQIVNGICPYTTEHRKQGCGICKKSFCRTGTEIGPCKNCKTQVTPLKK